MFMYFAQSEIIAYYDSCEIDYRLVWNLKQSQALHFGFWESDVANLSAALVRQNQWLAYRASIEKGSSILDAGCGVGGSSIYLANAFRCRVTGISLSKNQIETATANAMQANVSDLVDFKVCDYKDTGLESESFDVIWAIESVCHVPNKHDFINEAWRLLKPGGKLIVADGFYRCPESLFSLSELNLMRSWLHPWAVPSLVTPSEFFESLKERGFHENKIQAIDTTDLILPSSRILNRQALISWIPGHFMHWLKIRNRTQHLNLVAARRQWQALQQKLWLYYVFIAEKSK
ncbi:methyltransferase domain-containing protein [Leptospira sp. GIMC2001]|uniref:methyltransferase domain-containing protein n=1 Tax=Leptospira sp. GIMC2001 TaxID=1513297 RepID=UPI00234B9B7F|nr:methyltransferase domain-containing protein [Leptospira sp. GIMC2001]WCL47777.1 methyltransferase domain-containing protein [Leptospira sp. GIMC2001]